MDAGRTSTGHRGRRAGRIARGSALALAIALVALSATACEPRGEDKTKPVLLIHGWATGGATNCGSTFDRMISQMRSEGFTGPFIKVGFYTGDTNCDMSLRNWGSFDNGSSWVELSKAFSKFVYATYTSKGQLVDVVGYSMGGNIVRGALQGSQAGESGFSPPLLIEDVVSFGAPYNGAAWYSSLCLWGQCATLKPGASAINWLDANGNPQGIGGTEFTIFGSEADAVTPVDSALEMSIPSARKIRYTDVPHTGSDNYMGRASVVTRADHALANLDS